MNPHLRRLPATVEIFNESFQQYVDGISSNAPQPTEPLYGGTKRIYLANTDEEAMRDGRVRCMKYIALTSENLYREEHGEGRRHSARFPTLGAIHGALTSTRPSPVSS